MTKVYVNGKELARFDNFMLKFRDSYCMRLDGTDINTRAGVVTPLYIPLFEIERHPGQLILTFYIKRTSISFVFQGAAPWFAIEVGEAHYDLYEEDHDEDQV